MNLKELEQFRLTDAVKFHDKLNPLIFSDERMHDAVRQQLLDIAADFIMHLGINDFEIKDITISGSNAAYTYTKHSDIDLHILVDIEKLSNDEIYRELFDSKKIIYNDTHNIKIHGIDVELYVQDTNQPVKSLGEYSILRNRWIKFPSRTRSNLDERSTKEKFNKLVKLYHLAIKSKDLAAVDNLLYMIKKYRKAGLDFGGEFGPENLAFKAMRSKGYIDKLYALKNKLHSEFLSIDEQITDEDWHPNATPPGPEFKPTMPAGTVKVDVSDVYDWYKLGQHISNLHGLGHHDFGKGPPSTIMSFGSEDEEHKYIKDLEKTGLTTTDIDPVDPKQPKGMKRQKVDPTYNVDETMFLEASSGYIPSNAEKNDPRFKTALTVDVKPDSIKTNAKKLGLGNIHRSGIPKTARSDGKL